MRYLLLFENFEIEKLKSNRQLRREEWHRNNPKPVGKIFNFSDLSKFDIPESILNYMSKWNLIYKSPYSKSFYSSNDIGWSHKPDGSYRVSDHWNFKTNGNDNIHCMTDKPVENNSHISLGIFDKKIGKYKIILSELSQSQINKIKDDSNRRKYLQDPDTIYQKRLFKDRINKGEIIASFTMNGIERIGIIDKYTGPSMRIKDKNGNVIFTTSELKTNNLVLKDIYGNLIKNPF